MITVRNVLHYRPLLCKYKLIETSLIFVFGTAPPTDMATMVVTSKINSRFIISFSQAGVNHGGYQPTIKQKANRDKNICSQFLAKIKKGSTMDSHHTFCDIFKVQSHWPPVGITCKSHTQQIPANLTRTILLRARQ